MMMPPAGYGMMPHYPMMPVPAPLPPMEEASVAKPATPVDVIYAKVAFEETTLPNIAAPATTPSDEPAHPSSPLAERSPKTRPLSAPAHETIPSPPTHRFVRMWRQIGGGSLTLSILIHAGLLICAGLVVLTQAMQPKQVDFLPGGGTQQGAEASAALSHQIQQKRQQKLQKSMPMQRLVSTNLNSNVTLPEAPPDMIDLPNASSLLGSGGKLGGGGGYGSGGAGGGFGNGFGAGGLGGMTFKPLMMFGMELKNTRKIAVVMDVSRSMTRYLPIVAKELDKVAYGSPLVLYFGCGMKTPPRRLEDKVRKVSDERFDKFWYWWEGKEDMSMVRKEYDKLKVPSGESMPLEAVYRQMKKRPSTYFIDFNGINYTSPALICKEVMEADTIYWFSDFQDAVDVEHVQSIMRKLRGRKQKLYMHASVRGNSFEIVRDELCLPLGGEVLETKVE